jgi:hypothetical protein
MVSKSCGILPSTDRVLSDSFLLSDTLFIYLQMFNINILLSHPHLMIPHFEVTLNPPHSVIYLPTKRISQPHTRHFHESIRKLCRNPNSDKNDNQTINSLEPLRNNMRSHPRVNPRMHGVYREAYVASANEDRVGQQSRIDTAGRQDRHA